MTVDYTKAEILERSGTGTWSRRSCNVAQLFSSNEVPQAPSIIFLDAGELKNDTDVKTKARHAQLQDQLRIPLQFWTKAALAASGFFRAQEHLNAEGTLKVHESWLRLQTKQAKRENPVAGQRLGMISYHWDRLGFFIRWWPNQCFTAYCFDLPENLKAALRASVEASKFTAYLPASIWSLIVEATLPLFDAQVWKCRDLIRWHEQNRPIQDNVSATERPKPQYEDFHEIARHAIHSTEMLQTALHVLNAIQDEHSIFADQDTKRPQYREILRSLSYHKTILQGFEGRSRALETRLANEMQLTFHLNSQFDSIATGQIAQSSSEDSAAMRTISFLGLIFLPGTFISAIFSMSFFNFEPPNDAKTQEWRMSSKFWIFWVFCIPITGATILMWQWWHRRTRDRLRSTHSTFYFPDSDSKAQAQKMQKQLHGRRKDFAQPPDVEKAMMFDQTRRPGWTSFASSTSSRPSQG